MVLSWRVFCRAAVLAAVLCSLGVANGQGNAGMIHLAIEPEPPDLVSERLNLTVSASYDGGLDAVSFFAIQGGAGDYIDAFAFGDLGSAYNLTVDVNVSELYSGPYEYSYSAHTADNRTKMEEGTFHLRNPGLLDIAVTNVSAKGGIPGSHWALAPTVIETTLANQGDVGFGPADLWVEYYSDGVWHLIEHWFVALPAGSTFTVETEWDTLDPVLASEISLRGRVTLPDPFVDEVPANNELRGAWSLIP